MQHEMREEWGEALEILDTILQIDQANSSARKRKVRMDLFINSVRKEKASITTIFVRKRKIRMDRASVKKRKLRIHQVISSVRKWK